MPRFSTRVRPFAPLLLLSAFRPGRVTAAPAPAPRPNVIVVLLDDLDTKSAAAMPAMQRLIAGEGRTFANYLVAVPTCAPSRASLLRGQYAHNHGVLRSNGNMGGYQRFHDLGDEESTLAVWLRAAGYRTGLFGKYLNGYPGEQSSTYIPPGWDDWRANSHGDDGKNARNFYRFTLNENGTLVTYDDRVNDYATDVSARHAVEFIRASSTAGAPFFALLPLRAPHEPAQPAIVDLDAFDGAIAPRTPAFDEADVSDKPIWIQRTPPVSPETLAKTDAFQRDRLRTLLSVDRALETLVATLEETGQLANTYIIFTSDNGYHLGEHRQQLEKGTPYEESIRVPLIVRGPGIPAGTIESRLVSGADLAPTIAELTGAGIPAFVDGRSIVPLLMAEETPWRDTVLIETYRDPASLVYVEGALQYRTPPEQAAETDDEDRDDNPNQPAWRAIRTETTLYAEYATGEREYYDLTTDPWEGENGATDLDPARLVALSGQLAALSACAGETCRVADAADDPARLDPPPMPMIELPLPFEALSWDSPIQLQGLGLDGSGEELPDEALSWEVILHSAKGERLRERPMTGRNLEINPAKLPKSRRAFKDAWLEIILTVTDAKGRSRSTSVAYGLATPEAGIPGRKHATPVPLR